MIPAEPEPERVVPMTAEDERHMREVSADGEGEERWGGATGFG